MRFDYRGVGASRGVSRHGVGSTRIADLQDEVADLHRTCEHLLASTDMAEVCLVGYSFGAAVALEAVQEPRVGRLVLIAPPTQLYDFEAISAVRKPLLIVCAHQDPYCDRRALRPPDGARLEIIPHSDHFFGRGLTELGKTVAEWLRGDRSDYLAPPDGPEVGGAAAELELDPGDGEPLELDTDPE